MLLGPRGTLPPLVTLLSFLPLCACSQELSSPQPGRPSHSGVSAGVPSARVGLAPQGHPASAWSLWFFCCRCCAGRGRVCYHATLFVPQNTDNIISRLLTQVGCLKVGAGDTVSETHAAATEHFILILS